MNEIADLTKKTKKRLKKEASKKRSKIRKKLNEEKQKRLEEKAQNFIKVFTEKLFDPQTAKKREIAKILAKNSGLIKLTENTLSRSKDFHKIIPLSNSSRPPKKDMITVKDIKLRQIRNFITLVEKRCGIKTWLGRGNTYYLNHNLKITTKSNLYIRYRFVK